MLDPGVAGFWSIGAFVAGGLAAAFAAKRIDRCAAPALLDRVVPAGLWILFVARLGCLSNGCDYGRPTDLPIGLRYPAGSPAWEAQVADGLISPTAAVSAPTHPFPLYMAAVIATAIGVGSLAVRRLNSDRADGRPGERAMAVLLCYFLLRLAVESLRGVGSGLVTELAGFSITPGQWFSALAVAVLASMWWLNVGSD